MSTLYESAIETGPGAISIGTDVEVGKRGDSDIEEKEKQPVSDTDPIWVHWDGPDDPANPINWSRRRKWVISLAGILFCALVSLSVSGYAIGQGSVQTDLHASRELVVLGVTLFTFTFGAAPLILAPFSEVYGRNGIYFVSAVVFTLFFLPQALAQNIETMLVCRFISGIAGSTAVSLVGGTLADVWSTEDRGLPMALFSYAAFASTGLGPVLFGAVEYRYGFRYIAWILMAMSGTFTLSLLVILKETRASVLLSRKAKKLRLETGDARYQARDDFERGSLVVMLQTSLGRPIKMLFTEPVLLSFAVWISFVWCVLYILLESIPLVYEGVYGFNIEQSSFVFASQVVGATIGLVYRRNVATRGPEARLYTAMVGGCLVPLGAFIYTYTSYKNVPWIASVIGITVLYCGMYLVYLSCFNYLADSYTLYASSALSAQSFLRNFVGCLAPLFTHQMYGGLGIAGAGGLVAGIVAARIPVSIAITSDSICPFCFVGFRRIQSAVAQAKAAGLPLDFSISFSPFLLDPTLPPSPGVNKLERYYSKYGGETKVKAMIDAMAERGLPEGIKFSYGGMMSATADSHRLITKARELKGEAGQLATVERLFKTYFEEEGDPGSLDLLSRDAETAGVMTKDEALAFLKSDELKKEVQAEIVKAQQKGISGVPFTTLNGKWGITQETATFYEIFRQIADGELKD
ncbi:hypothetical protein RQP46_011440 [Phenoliferia psychrophenolica]